MSVWRYVIKDIIEKFNQRSIGTYASSTAFFLLLSIVPLLILFSSAFTAAGLTKSLIMDLLSYIPPLESNELVERIINEAFQISSNTLLPATVVVLIWSCSRSMLALIYGLNMIYGIKETKNYFYLRFLATLYTFLLILLFIAMFVLMVFGNLIIDLMSENLSKLRFGFMIAYQFRYLIIMIAGILIVTLIYKLVPNERHDYLLQVPGAVFTMIAWIILTAFFSLFVDATTYSAYYGSLAVTIIGMMWIYWCIYLMLVGAFINYYFEDIFYYGLFNLKRKLFRNRRGVRRNGREI
ncbi:YihY/virulence factor BrkB family protein [Catenisphaera adipataccumulans]|uniref:Membrane protein n=1 Tax=Catenisphaera adipataccumulans TaxID=700500 RepID=A0A7W8FVA6_9FIRM|nr:YihY/virulence factor BrkB family protein [Catenisphaera adipataccumulans]MBB5183444.1 membrane protein [Catenisphaera adipataccumulans]